MNVEKESHELINAIAGFKRYFFWSGVFSVFATLLVLAPTLYMLQVYDRVVNSRSLITLIMLSILVVIAYAVMEVMEWARVEVMSEAGLRFDQQFRDRIFNAIFEANLKRHSSGTIQPIQDLRTIRDFLHSSALLALFEIPVALTFLLIIFSISPTLGWFAILGVVLQIGLAWLTEKTTKPPLVAANRASITAQHYADSSLRNAEVIESMGMLTNIHRRWIKKQREFLGLQALASDRAGAQLALSRLVQNTQSSMLLGLGAYLMMRGQMSGGGGMMIVASILGGRVLAPIVQVIGQWQSVINVRDAHTRLEQLLTAIPIRPPAMPLPAPLGNLNVERITAVAPGSTIPILMGVAFSLKPGEVLAVVGPSASGKTTLARLLIGLWPAANGKVRLDGVDVFTWNKSELGKYLGYLPQAVELFDGTIAENIARFGEIDLEKIEDVARAVDLYEFILSLPEGYNTQVGRDGARLSGGQRQRIALARALYDNPVFVVLDEPNSNLDEAGESSLAKVIAQRKAQGTTFVVNTHRTNILGVVDKMLVLRDGAVQHYGTRDEVLNALKQKVTSVNPRK